MTNLVDLDTLREAVETDLPDATLTIYANAAQADVETAAADSERTVHLDGGTRTLGLPGPATVGTVTEAGTDLTAGTDFRVEHAGMTLRRLPTGRRWRATTVVYTPADATATKERVFVDLVKLAVAYRGLQSETAGDWSGTNPDYQAERDRILSALGRGRTLV